MLDPTIKTTIEEGNQLLEVAQNELNRSKEDVVHYLVCSNARQSMIKYLTAYLLRKNIEIGPIFTVEALLTKCSEVDPSFNRLDVKQMGCSNETRDASFCYDINKVTSCIGAAQMTKNLVTEERWPLSKRVK